MNLATAHMYGLSHLPLQTNLPVDSLRSLHLQPFSAKVLCPDLFYLVTIIKSQKGYFKDTFN